jgi:hypothetical protein
MISKHAWVALCVVALAACIPGTGHVKILGDGGSSDGPAIVAEGGPPADIGTPAEGSPPTDGQPVQPDGQPAVTPDTGPTGPVPPFGQSVGMTAADFQNIPDCDDNTYALHSYFNKKKGVLIAMMSPS